MPEPIPPAPLDAYVTAKPNEPTFTLQGGDPLAESLVILWVRYARACALGIAAQPEATISRLDQVAAENRLDEQREADALLVRATAAEQVAWDMAAYKKGQLSANANSGQNPHAENSLDEIARLDLHDLRVRYAQKLSSFSAEVNEMCEELVKRGFLNYEDSASGWEMHNSFEGAVRQLRQMSNVVEPRRMMK